ncbi:ester cyclase [Sphaerisporangium sp. TRM90804]|uniref:ester cyclase n=1 Tax=Sphaerisporangium sp. TRM90804 TaxID=3031113 RepID=UPI00244B23FA|nr:ester cyclase [Sphaerisporangium sp. TRM90804]MDH2424613.1 ester cyclase [Sphaerisporangium sp. TRM90804]
MSTYWDVKHRLSDAVNVHDLRAVLACYHPDAVYVTPAGVAEGHDQIAWFYEQVWQAFPDFHLTAWFEAAQCDNPAITEWTYTGTNTGPLLLPDGREFGPTGRRITVRATCGAHVEGDRIATHREYYDQLELYSQLGFGLTELEAGAAADTAVDGQASGSAQRRSCRGASRVASPGPGADRC